MHCPMEKVQGYDRSQYLLRIIPADNGVAFKKKTTKRTPYLLVILMAVAPVQYHPHCSIEGFHGYNGSHWLTPLGKYCG